MINVRAVTVTAFAFTVAMIGTTIPTALYPIYSDRLGFTSLTVTVLFAVYAVGVFTALLLFGRVSDQVGRRPVLIAALVFAVLSAAVFLVPPSLVTLIVGRLLSGVSAGLMTGTGTAAIIDLYPVGRRATAGVLAVAVNSGGLGLGNLFGGVVADLSASPLVVPFAIHLGLTLLAMVGLLVFGVDDRRRGGLVLRLERLTVPREIRGAFARGTLSAGAGFASSGVLTATTGLFLVRYLGISSHSAIGAIVCLIFTCVALGQLLTRRIPSRWAMPGACGVLVLSAGLLAWALAGEVLAPLIASAVAVGLGCGVCMNVGLSTTVERVPASLRGGVSSAFFAVIYMMLAFPAVGVGLLAIPLGLREAGLVFAGVVALLAAAVGASDLRASAQSHP
ncbi:MFS transporter [Gordonia sp. PDNC005]|uniref:MFS transporter n=1 Tax=unclassified Gordonia (in: high G+C Gram-positive bacteria) TaxID=2657482 RepID=UPI00196517EF|nr:MFS transporter [Gordonia sp. PDNC005]QRY64331.1 MFS transporter [Gordonia sp. PDNC005]